VAAERPTDHPRRPSRRWTGRRPTGRYLDSGDPEPGDPIIVNCTHPGSTLCPDCLEDFRAVLADVPFLLDQLDIAISQPFVRFVERGVPREGSGESKGNGHNPAISAHHRLVAALGTAGSWFDGCPPERLAMLLWRKLDALADQDAMRKIARDVSSAAARAHRVIDAPPHLWPYGDCPDCGKPIFQDRIHADDLDTKVVCRVLGCGYAETLAEHHRRQLALGDERWMTVSELLEAFQVNGQPLTRDQLNGMIRREGLPREARPLVDWREGRLTKTGEVWTYKVGHVKELLQRRERSA
jgi:hypothetical protein